jgi:hypothetical protein
VAISLEPDCSNTNDVLVRLPLPAVQSSPSLCPVASVGQGNNDPPLVALILSQGIVDTIICAEHPVWWDANQRSSLPPVASQGASETITRRVAF